MDILFLQTSDLEQYRPLLEVSAKTVGEYCARHNLQYQSYMGIRRGFYPWHATYNRILMLHDLVKSGFSGWVCYLDADALVVDLQFDLRKFLGTHSDISFIAAPVDADAPWWRINAGVFFLNLGHTVGQAIVQALADSFSAISDKELREAVVWDQIRDDQNMLQHALHLADRGESSTFIIRGNPNLINYGNGTFIKQYLRASGSLAQRLEYLTGEVKKILDLDKNKIAANASNQIVEEKYTEFISALYRSVLLREADPPGLANGVSALRRGKSFEESMKSCFRCREFEEKVSQFLATYIEPRDKKALVQNSG